MTFKGLMPWHETLLGNLTCGITSNYLFDLSKFVLPLPVRWLKNALSSGLPPNHDFERATMQSLRQALHFASDSTATELGRRPSKLSQLLGFDKVRGWLSNEEPSPVDRWFFALNAALRDAKKFAELADIPFLPQQDVAAILGSGTDRQPIEQEFARAVEAWSRKHAGAEPPEQWAKNLRDGFRAEAAKEKRIHLLDVWLLFLREELKTDERPFRAFLLDALANVRAQLPAEQSAQLPGNEALADEALAKMRDGLGTTLREQRVWMGEEFLKIQRELDEILSHSQHVQERLDAMEASAAQRHREQMEAVGQLLRIAETALKAKTDVPVGSEGNSTAVALRKTAEQFNVQPKTVEMALTEFASNARRDPEPDPKQKEIAREVEKQFHVQPKTTRVTQQDSGGVVFGRILFYVVVIFWGKDITKWVTDKYYEITGKPKPGQFELKTNDWLRREGGGLDPWKPLDGSERFPRMVLPTPTPKPGIQWTDGLLKPQPTPSALERFTKPNPSPLQSGGLLKPTPKPTPFEELLKQAPRPGNSPTSPQ
jgi:hypothetical protein